MEDLSGVAHDPADDSLWGVINGVPELVQFSREGKILRRVALRGFEDTEDLVLLGPGRFAVVEERRRNLAIFELLLNSTVVDYADATVTLIDPVPAGNAGIEGLAWDAARKRLFAVKEKNPMRIYEWAKAEKPVITHPWDAESHPFGVTDLSAVYYDPGTGHLLLLSDESATVVEVTTAGREVDRLVLKAGNAGLDHDVIQPEGITRDARGWLYVACEPNRVYVFRPGGDAAAKPPQTPSGR